MLQAALSFSQEIAAEAQEDANRCNEDVHLTEKAYEVALGSGVGVGEAEERLVFVSGQFPFFCMRQNTRREVEGGGMRRWVNRKRGE